MKKIILLTLCCIMQYWVHAQAHFTIGSGTHFSVSNAASVVMDTGEFVNNGFYTDSSGNFFAEGGINFGGTGVTRMNSLYINNTQHTKMNSLVSVYNTTKITAGNVDANDQLYIRSDVNLIANLIVIGVLSNPVKGIIARASMTSGTGCLPYTSNLTLNISGAAMLYQWQSSADSSVWTNIGGATNATYTATVSATTWYRCSLATNNSAFTQATPGVKHTFTGTLPNITGDSSVCAGASLPLAIAATGGTWISQNTGIATVNISTGVVTGVSAGGVLITYRQTPTCFKTKLIIVKAQPSAIGGIAAVCLGSSSILTNTVTGGIWTSTATSVATIGSTSGAVTGVAVGNSTITYDKAGCIATRVVTINPVPDVVTGTLFTCIGSTTVLSCATSGGVWSSTNLPVATVNSTGVVTGVGIGSTIIRYTLPVTGCRSSATVAVNTQPAAFTGSLSVCEGTTTTIATSTAGGTWSTANPVIASISATGVISGLVAGNTTVSYSMGGSCMRTAVVTVNPAVGPITGDMVVCLGQTTPLTNVSGGGTWISSSPSTATVTGISGIVSGVSAGTATITYRRATGCFTTTVVTVNSALAAISGTPNVCVGETTTLTHPSAGGTWSSSNVLRGTIGATSGVVTGISAGAMIVTYHLTTGCYKTLAFTVKALPSAMVGTGIVCEGATTTLPSATGGGTWSSSNTSIATVPLTSATVTGIAAGNATITYRGSNACITTRVVTVNTTPAAITGTPIVCVSATTVLSSATAGGNWISSNTTRATVTSTGIVTGVSSGGLTISYVMPTGCRALLPITVNAIPTAITGTLTVCAGSHTTLSNAIVGGTWSSSNPTTATVPTTPGTVSAHATGTATITYTIANGCTRTAEVTVAPAVSNTTGAATVCTGVNTPLSNTSTGGTWTSSNTTIAAVNVTTGLLVPISTGTAIITYRVSPACYNIHPITVNPTPAAITGTLRACHGTTTLLSSATAGGTWSSANTGVATVDALTGVVTGVATGTTHISYLLPAGCYRTVIVTINPIPTAIGGTPTVCVGGTSLLTNTTGAWSSSNTAVATVGASGGVTGISAGTAVITFTSGATLCSTTTVVTVNPLPVAITGAAATCPGNSFALTSGTVGGTWSSFNPAVASVDAATGLVTGVYIHNSLTTVTTIYYTLPTGCRTSVIVTVNPRPAAIAGAVPNICIGNTTALTNSTAGGNWSSDNASVATVSLTGVTTGIAAGTATISYANSYGCAAIRVVTVNTPPGSNSGTPSLCVGGTTLLTNASGSGTWSSSNAARATVGLTTGVVTGISTGTAFITYTVATACNSVTMVTVNPALAAITGDNTVCITLSTTYTHPVTGGTWSSSDGAVATVSSTGTVTGVAMGTATISYQSGSCVATKIVTVNCTARPTVAETDEVKAAFNLYPNPTTGAINIYTSVAGKGWIQTVDGKQLQEFEVEAGNTSLTLPNDITSGIYLLRFVGVDGSSNMVRLILNH